SYYPLLLHTFPTISTTTCATPSKSRISSHLFSFLKLKSEPGHVNYSRATEAPVLRRNPRPSSRKASHSSKRTSRSRFTPTYLHTTHNVSSRLLSRRRSAPIRPTAVPSTIVRSTAVRWLPARSTSNAVPARLPTAGATATKKGSRLLGCVSRDAVLLFCV
ncbi:uncharacterized protein SEPMUDRAFT_130028, partial [Sphaerulina musiva SO2202]